MVCLESRPSFELRNFQTILRTELEWKQEGKAKAQCTIKMLQFSLVKSFSSLEEEI